MVETDLPQHRIEIRRVTTPTPEVRRLIAELDDFLSQNYAPEQRHGLALDAIFQPHMRFFVAWTKGDAIGCGGVALFPDFAELKRMFVQPTARGKGVADALLSRLEQEAQAAGLTTLRLETGIHQPAALRFYERSGFQPCAAFEPYTSLPPDSIATSIFLEKQLAAND